MNGLFLILLMVMHTVSLHATVLIRGNGTNPQTFAVAISAKAFDIASGQLFVGLSATAQAAFAVSAVGRTATSPTPPPQFTGIGSNAVVNNKIIDLLSLATFQGNTTPFVIGVARTLVAPLIPKNVFALSSTGAQGIESATLLDANGLIDVNGTAIGGIVWVAGNYNFIFALVKPSIGQFGDINGGVAVVRINITKPSGNPVLGTLTQTSAVPGDEGIKAQKVDNTIAEVKTAATVTAPTITPNGGILQWDDALQRLYIGLEITTGAGATDGAKSIVVGRSAFGKLYLYPFFPDSVALAAGQNDRMVGVINNGVTAESLLASQQNRVMHTSTGTSYLIINGGNGTSSTAGNQLYALPLVDDPENITVHGTLASKNAPVVVKDANLGTVRFVTPATANGDMPLNTEAAVRVGNGPFPFRAPHIISDLVVVGDTVYASSNVPQSDTDETGVFYSQAMFDSTGKIVRWTPWAKRAFPIDGIPNELMTGRIKFFDVDPSTGNVYGIDDDTGRTVALTQWDHDKLDASLVARLNVALHDGAYSVLDLDQATRGLGTDTASRYALFGGVAKIVFARTSVSRSAAAPFDINAGTQVPYPQRVITNYASPEDFITTHLPGNAGCVTHLEFARRFASEGATNYFFAGTCSGLYVFTNRIGNGLNVAAFDDLNAPPFSNGIWQKAPNIPGAIVDIKTSGKMLYVLTLQSTAQQPYKSVLYRIPFQTTLAAMFAPANIVTIAQTNTLPTFNRTTLFTGIQIIKTGSIADVQAKEQLALATNTGLFVSAADQVAFNGIIDALSQTDANWQLQDGNAMYSSIGGIDTPLPATVWPVSIRDNSKFCTNERSTVQQLNGNGSTLGSSAFFGFVPTLFNASSTAQQFATLPPTNYFVSDGARRFFIVNSLANAPSSSQLMMLPWNVQDSKISSTTNSILFGQALKTETALFWVRQIGATGIFMAGTPAGVVGLE